MNYAWDAIRKHVAAAIAEVAGSSVNVDELVTPPKAELGDLAFGCFRLAKDLKKSPADIAKRLAEKIPTYDPTIEKFSAEGPYLNITLRAEELTRRIIGDIERDGELFGHAPVASSKKLMLEYAQPNTHKEIHIGHLRNLILGSSLVKLFEADGHRVVTASFHGDVGAHITKCLWFLVRLHGKTLVADLSETDAKTMLNNVPQGRQMDEYLGEVYTQATQALEEYPEWKEEVSRVQQALENCHPAWTKLWQETRRWSLARIKDVFSELGVVIERPYFESEVLVEGKRLVGELVARGIAKESQGATIVDLEDQKLGVAVVQKSDGTSLYLTNDLALAYLKRREYPDIQRSIIFVDQRQMLHFDQLAATLRLLGFEHPPEFVGFEIVTLPEGAMSSRKGNIVTWETFKREVLAYATKETTDRHPEWNEGKVTHTAWCLMMGGIRFGILRQDSERILVFDVKQALSFDGATGPYIQYAATRLASILKKGEWKREAKEHDRELRGLASPAEKHLALALASFPEIIHRAATELRPSILAQWCWDVASTANAFYREAPVLDAEPELRAARLRLVAATHAVLRNGLELLGIPLPEEM